MNNLLLALALILAVTFFARGLYAKLDTKLLNTQDPVVIELFTSQSCSSCPPADKILSQLAEQENVIALGCHVSYWNHLHWKDTLSHEFCDVRQHGYGQYSGKKQIYTPQMIVNGQEQFVGSRADHLNAALKRTTTAPLKPIQIEKTSNNSITFTLPDVESDEYRLWAFGYKLKHNQNIPSGENRGLKTTYANPIASYINLGSWSGQAAYQQFDLSKENIDAIAILAQKGGYGPIVAAGKMSLR